jgi:hypothetical protein
MSIQTSKLSALKRKYLDRDLRENKLHISVTRVQNEFYTQATKLR